MMRTLLRYWLPLCTMILFPTLSQAWWHEDWTFRTEIKSDAPADAGPVLIRLHTGNFIFADAREDGADLRFIAADDKTVLKHHVEKWDALTEIALVWVQASPGSVFMYYGNPQASAAVDVMGSYATAPRAILHFAAPENLTLEATGQIKSVQFNGLSYSDGGIIGGAAALKGGQITLPTMSPAGASGSTIALWVKPSNVQNAPLYTQHNGNAGLEIRLRDGAVYAEIRSRSGAMTPLIAPQSPIAGQWVHLALTLAADRAVLYMNGAEVAAASVVAAPMDGAIVIGGGPTVDFELDELQILGTPLSAAALRFAAQSQGPAAIGISYGTTETNSEGATTSHFKTILQSVTIDGWVVIGILIFMAALSWLVMFAKALVVQRVDKDNRQFIHAFHKLKLADTAALDQDDDAAEADLRGSEVMMALFGKRDHYQNSTLYHLYHSGVQEIKHRVHGRGGKNSDISAYRMGVQAVEAIRASLDATLVRENQKLNRHMVWLTIAISGGPFLGLLGTVVGVMITFAAIAASGDVNVNAIAPGIAAALVATVAGLAVAIPALFGYNYLASRLKNISADMQVFVDEFVTRAAEAYAD